MPQSQPQDKVRVLRILEYVGPREWVEAVLARSTHGTRVFSLGCEIRGATLGAYPEILESHAIDSPPL